MLGGSYLFRRMTTKLGLLFSHIDWLYILIAAFATVIRLIHSSVIFYSPTSDMSAYVENASRLFQPQSVATGLILFPPGLCALAFFSNSCCGILSFETNSYHSGGGLRIGKPPLDEKC